METRKYLQLGLILPMALVLAACPKSPEEKLAKLRSYYTARVVGIVVDAVPVPEPALEDPTGETEGESPAAGEAEAADGGEGEVMDAPVVPVRQNVRVDILLQHDSPEKLPGITLDLEMVDAQEALKHSWKVWVDTSKLPKATGTQFTHLLEDIDYVEGDGFSVEVRSHVPPEERGEYKEFTPPAGG